jgi:glutamate 5-kinase
MSEAGVRRIVVKVGTSTLTDAGGHIDAPYIHGLARQLVAQRAAGRDVLLVTSGAIRVGRDRLETAGGPLSAKPNSTPLPIKQACAAVGQGLLMHTYTDAFAAHNVPVAQVLLTRDDLSDRRRFLNARNTLLAALDLGVVPIINENDTVAVDEIKFGDNDTLAARVAVVVEADLLLLLSDVDGLYTAPPGTDDAATMIATVDRIDAGIEALAGGAGSDGATGGMRTKIEAARIATRSGIRTVIAHGEHSDAIALAVADKPAGTVFLPETVKLRGRKRWILAGSRARGYVTVNECAVPALAGGASLLAVGITAVEGAFDAGDLIEVRDAAGTRIARGLTNYSADDVHAILGLHSDRIEAVLGHKPYDEVIHRDNLAMVR